MTPDVQELWIDYGEGLYQISNLGRVKRMPKFEKARDNGIRFKDFKILEPKPKSDGYIEVKLYRPDGSYVARKVHRLVAALFVPNTYGKPEVNHKDLNKANNRWDNLEWVTALENTQHAILNGAFKVGSLSNKAKLNEVQVIEIRELLREGFGVQAIADHYAVDNGTISAIKLGKTWKHLLKSQL